VSDEARWQVRFVEWDALKGFGNPHYSATRLKAQTALGYVPWPFISIHGAPGNAGVLAHCPYCGSIGSARWAGGGPLWTWNGNADSPTLSPSLHMPVGSGGCGFHCWVRDGQIIDAGTPPHGEERRDVTSVYGGNR
jgi:hypothetical protein